MNPLSASIQKNIQVIRDQIKEAALKAHRSPESIVLIAVSKTKPASMIREAVTERLLDIGENYVQEWAKKNEALKDLPIRWHLIGSLQRKKVKDIIGKIHVIHSLDSLSLAEEIQKQAVKKNVIQKCLLQINISEEATKSGISVDKAKALLQQLNSLDHIEVQGLMTVPPPIQDPEQSRPYFTELRQLRDSLDMSAVYRRPLTELSMGMTHDFKSAIEEGATFIRIGTALFGERI